MSKAPKIAIIGAGSAVFSLSLIRDLTSSEVLGGAEVALMDIDATRLQNVEGLARRYTDELGTDVRISATDNRREALAGADFVINSALVAGHDRLREGWSIAERHGYRFGGSLHVMHDEAFWINFYQLQLFDSIIEDVLDLCPKAWYLQIANPVFAGITRLGREYPDARIIGLCHGYGAAYGLANRLGVPSDELDFEIAGVNHHVWLTRATHGGEDLLPRVDAYEPRDTDQWNETPTEESEQYGPKAVDLCRCFGLFPIGDTPGASGGAWPWWYYANEAVERQWHQYPQAWWNWYFGYVDDQVALVQRMLTATQPLLELFPREPSGEPTVPVLEALAGGPSRTMILNVPNTGGGLERIPEDIAVELPCHVTSEGITTAASRQLPRALIAHILRDRVAPVELELEAFEKGSREYLRQLLLTDPWTRSRQQADDFLTDICSLPYHTDLAAHYGAGDMAGTK